MFVRSTFDPRWRFGRLTAAFAIKRPQCRAGGPRHGEAGFTLVEMLVVIAIIGLVMGLVGPRVLGYLSDSKVKTARIQIQGFSSALNLFYLDNGRYPTSAEGTRSFGSKAGRRHLVEWPLL